MSKVDEQTMRVCSIILGSLLVILSFWEVLCAPNNGHSRTFRMILAYVCIWIGSLLVKRSFHTTELGQAVICSQTHPTSGIRESRWKRPSRQVSSSCPKPYTPTAPIRVIPVRNQKTVSSSHRRRGAGNKPGTVPSLPPADAESHISSCNNESFMTVSTECPSWSPKNSEQRFDVSSNRKSRNIPDSIAAIWEPVEPTSSKLW